MGLIIVAVAIVVFFYFYKSAKKEDSKHKEKQILISDVEQSINALKGKARVFSKSVFSGKTRCRDDFICLQNARDNLILEYVNLKHRYNIICHGIDDYNKTHEIYSVIGSSDLGMNTASDFIDEILEDYANRRAYRHIEEENFDHLYIYQEVIPLLSEPFEFFETDFGGHWQPAVAMKKRGYKLDSCKWFFSRKSIGRGNLEYNKNSDRFPPTEFKIKFDCEDEDENALSYDDVINFTYPYDACPPRLFLEEIAHEESEYSDVYYSFYAYQQQISDDCNMILLCNFYKLKEKVLSQSA